MTSLENHPAANTFYPAAQASKHPGLEPANDYNPMAEMDAVQDQILRLEQEKANIRERAIKTATMTLNQGIRQLQELSALHEVLKSHGYGPIATIETLVAQHNIKHVESTDIAEGAKEKPIRITRRSANKNVGPTKTTTSTESKPRGWLTNTLREIMSVTNAGHLMHASVILKQLQLRGYAGGLPGIINTMRSPAQRAHFHNAGKNQWFYTEAGSSEPIKKAGRKKNAR